MIDLRGLAERLGEVHQSCTARGIEVAGLAEHAALLADLAAFSDCIDVTRRRVGFMGAATIGRHIPEANEELDAIVIGTAAATDIILSTCEQLEFAVAGLPDSCSAPVRSATARIFEACCFQDITGQHVAKVGHVLKLIDGKVARIETAFAAGLAAPDAPATPSLLNGPQVGGGGMDQGAVDVLFGSIG